jgi:23S rRNA (guanosine2251-2'-O)-methyltransferase
MNKFKDQARDNFPPKDQLVMGLHSIEELLRHAPKRIVRVYTSTRTSRDRKISLLKECEKYQIPIEDMTENQLEKLCGSDSHQSFAAQVKGRKFLTIKEFLEETQNQEHVLVLMCDQIFDPQNFGAILRCGECFGADGLRIAAVI